MLHGYQMLWKWLIIATWSCYLWSWDINEYEYIFCPISLTFGTDSSKKGLTVSLEPVTYENGKNCRSGGHDV